MEDLEKWAEGEEPAHSFAYYCGLDTTNFPPPQQLNDAEMKMI